jgi:hypothetical protein
LLSNPQCKKGKTLAEEIKKADKKRNEDNKLNAGKVSKATGKVSKSADKVSKADKASKTDKKLIADKKPKSNKKLLEIKNKAAELIGSEFSVEFFKTSIYDMWTIMAAFSKVLLTLYPQSELIDKTIHEFAEKNDEDAILILDDNSLIIGQFFKNDESRTILEQSTPYFLTLNDSFANAELPKKKMIVERSGKSFYFNEIKFEGDKGDRKPLYLLIMKSKNEFDESNIETFSKIVRDLV